MIHTLLAIDGALIRGAVALVLTMQDDIDVVAELDRVDEISSAVRAKQPDVAIVDATLIQPESWPDQVLAVFGRSCALLVLVDPRRSATLTGALGEQRGWVGFLGNAVAPERLVDSVRRIHRGEPVLDPDLVVAALNRSNPLTARESEVLSVAAQGWPVAEIAAKLGLAPGTVRNHLSRIAGKTGARTRIEAVRIAREAGWI